MSNVDQNTTNATEQTGKNGVNRRKLMRAGLSAAPVLAAFKTKTALAGSDYCIRPSSFASISPDGKINIALSQGRVINDDYYCKSHGYWKKNNGNLADKFKERGFLIDTGFTANPGSVYKYLDNGKWKYRSFQWVLEQDGNSNYAALARHIVASYLSAVSSSDVDVILTKAQCVDCWNKLAGGSGTWSPFAGAQWNLDMTMAYFKKVYTSVTY